MLSDAKAVLKKLAQPLKDLSREHATWTAESMPQVAMAKADGFLSQLNDIVGACQPIVLAEGSIEMEVPIDVKEVPALARDVTKFTQLAKSTAARMRQNFDS